MLTDTSSFKNLRTVGEFLDRTPHGRELVDFLKKLGFWIDGTNPANPEQRRPFPRQIPTNPEDLGNLGFYWQSELSRVTEILGVLDSQRYKLGIDSKRARAAAAARLHRQRAEEITNAEDSSKLKPYTATQIGALVEDDVTVKEADDKIVLVEMLYRALDALRVSFDGYCRTVSREVTRQGDLAKYRL